MLTHSVRSLQEYTGRLISPLFHNSVNTCGDYTAYIGNGMRNLHSGVSHF
jgi:hypothetical protein